jgi:hypothetical protein
MAEDDEDTIELVLTPEQIAALMRAAAPEPETPAPEQIPAAPELIPPAPELIPPVAPPAPLRTRFLEVQLRAIRVPAIITLTVFALSLSGVKYAAVSHEQDIPIGPAPSAVAQVAEPTPPPPEPAPPSEPVHFTNPFDASEAFDFPAGTSREEARAAVAEMLLERARSRTTTAR